MTSVVSRWQKATKGGYSYCVVHEDVEALKESADGGDVEVDDKFIEGVPKSCNKSTVNLNIWNSIWFTIGTFKTKIPEMKRL